MSAEQPRVLPEYNKNYQSKLDYGSKKNSTEMNQKYFEISPYTDRRGEKPKLPGKIAFCHVDTEKENVYDRNVKNSNAEFLIRSSTFTQEERRSLSPGRDKKTSNSKVFY